MTHAPVAPAPGHGHDRPGGADGVTAELPGAGPTVPVPAAPADVTRYLEAYSELLAQLR